MCYTKLSNDLNRGRKGAHPGRDDVEAICTGIYIRTLRGDRFGACPVLVSFRILFPTAVGGHIFHTRVSMLVYDVGWEPY